MKVVKSLEELKSICLNEYKDFYISLANGLAKSSKEIMYNEEENIFHVFSAINGEYFDYTEKELSKYTNILQAIKTGTLIQERI
tara:strand:+ start:4123 stop:4374 length:252 start_codon:yes stop_codon:yes gene_type:complete